MTTARVRNGIGGSWRTESGVRVYWRTAPRRSTQAYGSRNASGALLTTGQPEDAGRARQQYGAAESAQGDGGVRGAGLRQLPTG